LKEFYREVCYMFRVYILKCSDNSYYTGHTDNLEKRISEHGSGEIIGYTHSRWPVKLVYTVELPTRYEALPRERQIKRWSRRKKEALIEND
jgi:predicted GIY-YIG superfamily endonuclease